MVQFSESYSKARAALQTAKYAKAWQTFIDTESNLKLVLSDDGPDAVHGASLDKLRKKLDESAKKGFTTFFTGNGLDEVIVAAAREKDTDKTIGTKAATLKLLKHLYLQRQVGNQDVWIYSPPKSYNDCVFAEVSGDERKIKSRLRQEREVYTAKERVIMCDALQEAAAWCQKIAVALDDKKTEQLIRDWFMDSTATAQHLTQAIVTLRDGFRKIDVCCRSGKLIFSDEPKDRKGGGWKDWAFVNVETLKVVYLQGAFLKAGNSGNKTMCALTIIHELTHKLLRTDDHMYDYQGLKPKAALTFAQAIDNADSWAYFAADVAGMLTASDRKKVLR
jgi:hypothetical protein